MTLEATLGTEQDLLLAFLPLPQVTEQEVQGLHLVQLSTLGHLSELHTEDSRLAPSHFSWLTRHILLLQELTISVNIPATSTTTYRTVFPPPQL